MRHLTFTLCAGLLALPLVSCAKPLRVSNEAAQQQMLTLLMPSRIEIVEPFTRVASLDEDNIPDGIELLVQAFNALDNPGVMIVGRVRAELFEYVPASADARGARVEHWEVELASADQQRMYWNHLTQMYEFRLRVTPTAAPPADKYVLAVTYHTPLGERLVDEFIIDCSDLAAPPPTTRPTRP